MFVAFLFVVSVAVGSFALPFGLLPSVFCFRDLANGVDASERTKRRYAVTLWAGLLTSWLVGSGVAFVVLNTLLR